MMDHYFQVDQAGPEARSARYNLTKDVLDSCLAADDCAVSVEDRVLQVKEAAFDLLKNHQEVHCPGEEGELLLKVSKESFLELPHHLRKVVFRCLRHHLKLPFTHLVVVSSEIEKKKTEHSFHWDWDEKLKYLTQGERPPSIELRVSKASGKMVDRLKGLGLQVATPAA